MTTLAAIATVLMAIATFVLAYVSFKRDIWHQQRTRPILDVSLPENQHPAFRSIVVSNNRGLGPAKNVQVLLLALTKEKGKPRVVIDQGLPLNLQWLGQSSHDRILPSIPRGTYFECAIAIVDVHKNGDGHDDLVCQLPAKGTESTKIRLPRGTYTLTICVVADNHLPVRATLRLQSGEFPLSSVEHDVVWRTRLAVGPRVAELSSFSIVEDGPGDGPWPDERRCVFKVDLKPCEPGLTRWPSSVGWGFTGQIGRLSLSCGFRRPNAPQQALPAVER